MKLLRYIELKSGHSDNGPAWIGLAISLENLQRRGDAAEAYRRALASDTLAAEAKKYAEQKIRELR